MGDRATREESLIGLDLGHYHVTEKIGAGGMGEVYRAFDQHLARDVAIKVLPPRVLEDCSARKHFRKEALALSKLSHPNIAAIYDFDTQRNFQFLVMEYVHGVTLSKKLIKCPLLEKDVIALGTQLAEGLCAAHTHGVVHRDLKPANLRVTDDGWLKILDFGLARLREPATATATTESVSDTKSLAGTLPYMAPEQLLGGEVDCRTDIYAAGLILFEMATAQYPFSVDSRSELIGAILRSPLSYPKHMNPELKRIIAKCMEKDPADRYQSAGDLAVDLRRLKAVANPAQNMPIKPWSHVSIRLFAGILIAVLMALPIASWWRRKAAGSVGVPVIRSLAVLPLANLSSDPQQDYFADGMTEQLITHIGKLGGLRVISRTSVMQYKQTKEALPALARKLNVDAFVEGSILRSGNRVRVTAQLLQADPERQLWAETYERDFRDVLAIQADVALAVATEVRVKLTPAEQSSLSSVRPVEPAAYEAYLQGRYYWNQRSRDGVLRGLEFFKQAVRLDPSYALAYAGEADSYIVLAGLNWFSPGAAIPPARATALKALSLDETLAEAHTSLASVAESDWDWPNAEKEYRRALELNSNYATARHWYSLFLAEMGRDEEAAVQSRRALELDPLSPSINTNLGEVLYTGRHYQQAQRVLLKLIANMPQFWPAYYCLGRAYLQTGQFDEGIAALREAALLSSRNDMVLSALIYAYGRASKKNDALELLDEWKDLSRHRYSSGYLWALSYAGLGQKENAMQSLAKAYQERDTLLISLATESMLDPLRSDSRFQEMLRQINLPANTARN